MDLIELFKGTLQQDNSVIKRSEEILSQLQKQPLFINQLINLVDNQQHEFSIRLACVIYLKNTVKSLWKYNKFVEFQLLQADRECLKSIILDAIYRTVNEKQIRSQYEDIFFKIIGYEFPTNWNNLQTIIIERLVKSSSVQETFAMLIALRKLCEYFQYLNSADRIPLDGIVNDSFGILENLAVQLITNFNEQTAVLLEIILKIFNHSSYLVLPNYLMKIENFKKFFDILKTVMDISLPQNLCQFTHNEEEKKTLGQNPMWKCKKNASRLLLRIIQKFSNPDMVDNEIKEYAQQIQDTFSIYSISQCLQIFISKKVLLNSVKMIIYSMKLKKTREFLIPYYDQLLFDISLNLIQLSREDEQLWVDDPEEYIRRSEDFTNCFYNIKHTTIDLIATLCDQKDINGQDLLISFLRYAYISFNNNIDERTKQTLSPLKKEALMWAIESLSQKVKKLKTLNIDIEYILEHHIIPEFNNSIGFLRARACTLFDNYGGIDFQNKKNITLAVQGISKCILDNELPVRVKAAVALSSVLKHKETIELLSTSLPQILETYIKLMEIIDHEGIISSLEDIVNKFSDKIGPYASTLIMHLSTLFIKYADKTNSSKEEDDSGESEMAASGCLTAITRIMNGNLEQQFYVQCIQMLIPIFNFSFRNIGSTFINESIDILHSLTYKLEKLNLVPIYYLFSLLIYIPVGLPENFVIPSDLNNVQQLLFEDAKTGWGYEFMGDIIGPIKNFIQKFTWEELNSIDLLGNNRLKMLIQFIQKAFDICQNSTYELDAANTIDLLNALVENHPQSIDVVLEIALAFGTKAQSEILKLQSVNAICLCFSVNFAFTFQYLTCKNLYDATLKAILQMSKRFNQPWELHRLVICLTNIIKFQLDTNIFNEPEMLKVLVKAIKLSLEKREEDEDEDNSDEDIENEEYDENFESRNDYSYLYQSPMEKIDEIIHFINVLSQTPDLQIQLKTQLSKDEFIELESDLKKGQEQYQEWLLQQGK